MNFNLFKPYSLFFYSTLLLGVFISLSARNWFSIWIGLELNLYSLTPLLLHSIKNQEKEAAVKYFLVQALASGALIIAALNFNSNTIFAPLLTLSLVIKLGIAPCHFWLPNVINSVTWKICWILSTIQKIAPLFILTQLIDSLSSSLIILLASSRALVGGLGGLNQTQLRPILAYSSIGHLGWITARTLTRPILTLLYFFTYIIIISSIILTLSWAQNYSSNFTLTLPQINTKHKTTLIITLFRLGGVPPFLGFYPKFLIIYSLIEQKLFSITIILIFSATINLFFYIKIISSIFFTTPLLKTTSPNSHFINILTTILSILSILPPVIFIPIILII